MDGYHKHEKGGEFVTYERLRAMGTNGFQEPAIDFKDGKIVGTKRLFADGKFGGKDGKATFMETKWRGLQAPGKEAERNKWPFLINNGRTNIVWQNAYLDQDNEFVMDRLPYPFIQMNPQDMAELKVKEGDLVEVYNDNGSTQAMVYPTPTAKRKQTFMLFAYPTGRAGQRRLAWRQRVHHPELQADLGRYPQDRRRARRRAASDVQVGGIRGRLIRFGLWSRSGGDFAPRPLVDLAMPCASTDHALLIPGRNDLASNDRVPDLGRHPFAHQHRADRITSSNQAHLRPGQRRERRFEIEPDAAGADQPDHRRTRGY